MDIEQPVSIRGRQVEHLLAFFWMTIDDLLIVYRGEREGAAEMHCLSIGPNEDGQVPATQVRSQPILKKSAMSGRCLNRLSAAEQLSSILPIQKLPWRSDRAKSEASNVEQELASIELGKGNELVATSVWNGYGDIILKREDIRRWQMTEKLVIEDLSRRIDDDD